MLPSNIKLHDAIAGLKHDQRRGWPLHFPEIKDETLNIHFKDDLTYHVGKIIEIERYRSYYKDKIKHVVFYTEHLGIKDFFKDAKELNFVFYPGMLHQQNVWMKLNKNKLDTVFNFDNKASKFLCLNWQARPHRDMVVDKLKEIDNSIYSYVARNKMLELQNNNSISDYKSFSPWGDDIENFKSLDKETFHPIYQNYRNLLSCAALFNSTCFSLVTETRFHLPFDYVTEKTIHALLALHPALYVSNKWHVKCMRQWGFDVFDDLFDHGYDSQPNHKRIQTLFSANSRQLTHGIVITDEIKARLYKNRQHYYSNFNDVLTELYKLSH